MKKELTDLFKNSEISEASDISEFLNRSVSSFFIINLIPHLMPKI